MLKLHCGLPGDSLRFITIHSLDNLFSIGIEPGDATSPFVDLQLFKFRR